MKPFSFCELNGRINFLSQIEENSNRHYYREQYIEKHVRKNKTLRCAKSIDHKQSEPNATLMSTVIV